MIIHLIIYQLKLALKSKTFPTRILREVRLLKHCPAYWSQSALLDLVECLLQSMPMLQTNILLVNTCIRIELVINKNEIFTGVVWSVLPKQFCQIRLSEKDAPQEEITIGMGDNRAVVFERKSPCQLSRGCRFHLKHIVYFV